MPEGVTIRIARGHCVCCDGYGLRKFAETCTVSVCLDCQSQRGGRSPFGGFVA